MPKIKTPKITPEELQESLRQEEASRYAEEQERFRTKAAQEQKEHNQRRVLLVETTKFFRKLEKNASDHRRQLGCRREWADFLSCRKLPNPRSAADLREQLYRWTFQEEALTRTGSNSCCSQGPSERSTLGPDFGQNRSTQNNSEEINRNIGGTNLPTVREALAVLQSIEDDSMQIEEVLTVRDEIRKFISDSLDRMTFRIGSNVGRCMETMNPWMSEFYSQESDVLSMFLWSFRHVPLPPNYNLLMKVCHMEPLGLTLNRPEALDLSDSLIRGFWLEFDHFSNHDPTCIVPPPSPVPELTLAHETEWNERQEVRRKRLAALRKLREEYEAEEIIERAKAEALAAETSKGSSRAGKGSNRKAEGTKGTKKNKQFSVQDVAPPLITEDTEVDIDEEYERVENDRFWASMASVGRSALPLKEGYINLREFSIVGGVFKLSRFHKLPQTVELRPGFMYSNVPVGLQLSEKVFRAVEGEELIKIELRLPKQCFWWEQPTVCYWEPWEDSEECARLRPKVQQLHLKNTTIGANDTAHLFTAGERISDRLAVPKIMQDFDLADIPAEVRLHYLIREHILPRLPEAYRFRPELKRLYTILKDRTEHQIARRREQLAWNGMMVKYNRFLETSPDHDAGSLPEMRHPNDSDIAVEMVHAYERRSTGGCSASVELRELDEILQQFSLDRPGEPRYLHPPVHQVRPLVVIECGRSETPLDDLGVKIDQLVLALQSWDTMLDDGADERLCKVFSTFLKVLEYLRKKENPMFPPLPSTSATEEQRKEPTQVVLRTLKRRVDIRTTKKYPLGLGSRARSLSRLSGSSVGTMVEKKKRKRKSTPVRAESSSQPETIQQVEEPDESLEEVMSLIEHKSGRWSTKPIRNQSYDANERLLTFWTDRLGTYGLAARKYCHLPFAHWEMRRHGRVANLTTAITLRAPGVYILFYVSSEGFRVQLQDHDASSGKTETAGRENTRFAPESGWFSLEELEKYLHKKNVHVFPQVDTCFYTAGWVTGSPAVPKHEPMELHNLRCLGAFCLTHNLERCVWNEYASRRTALVLSRQLIEGRQDPEFETIMITPLKSLLVEVEELCSPSLAEVLLAFHPRPAEQSYNADCYGLLKDGLEEPSRKVLAKTPPLLQWNVGQLLQKLRLLSYS